MTATTLASPNKLFAKSRYRLHEILGEGGMGAVYRATDCLTGELVALKRVTAIHRVRLFNPLTLEQTTEALRTALTREFQTLASLRHPNIISVLDYGFDATQQPFYAMMFLPDAQTLLEAGRDRSPSAKLGLLEQVLQALIYLHRRGVLHRDLKPDNILVSKDVVRVLDFGLAASPVGGASATGSEGGTAYYTTPEVWEGKPYTVTADLFAVGILGCQLFSEAHPFGPLDHSFLDRVLDDEPNLVGLPPELKDIFARLLAKEPHQRFQDADSVLAALAEATGRPPIVETEAVRESFLQAATFVGRQAEMEKLSLALQQAQVGHGSTWLIGGESGVGKSRLLNELRIRALVEGFQVVRGQGTQGSGLPYQLWREPLRNLLVTAPHVDDLTASVLLAIIPDIGLLLEREVKPAPELEDKAAQTRLLVTITQLFWQAPQPILLILEDLHWAEESLMPLPYFTRLVNEHRLLMVGTYRDDERPNLPTLIPNTHLLPLSRFTTTEMETLSAAMLGEAGLHPDVLALIQRETEGNAFFTVEVVRELASQAGRLGGIGQISLPQTLLPNGIQDIITRRLEKIPAAGRELLMQAAILGRELELPILKTLAGSIDVENWWLPTCAEAAVLEIFQGRWQFQHDKIRAGLLAALDPAQVARRHQTAAEAVEALYPDDAQQAARLAHHWGQANNPAKESAYALRAGHQATAQYAHREAIQFFQRALALTPAKALAQRYEILQECVNAQNFLGERAAQAEALTQLTALAEQLQDAAKTGATLILHAHYQHDLGQYAQAEAYYEQALAHATHNEAQSAQILSDWSSTLSTNKKLESALEKALQSEAIYQRLGDEQNEERNRYILGLIYRNLGEHQKSRAAFESSLNFFKSRAHTLNLTRALNGLGLLYNSMGELEKAREAFEESLALARQTGDLFNEARMLNNLGFLNENRGAYDLAIEQLQQSLRLGQRLADQVNTSYILNNLGVVYFKKGAFAEAKTHFQQAIVVKQALKDAWSEAYTWNKLGHLHGALAEKTEALVAYQRADGLLQTVSFTPIAVECWAGLAEAHWWLDQPTAALAYAEKVWAYIEEKGLIGYWEWAAGSLKVYRIFVDLHDTRGKQLLALAHTAVQTQAAKISDPTLRASFLENVPEHREITALYATLAPE